MTKWIESQEALMLILKHGEVVYEYQKHLDDDVWNAIEWDEDTGQPLNFDDWLIEFQEQIDWENSDEFEKLVQRGVDRND